MPDYKLGKIYKVVNVKTGMVYIGSTAQPTLARRMVNHRSDYRFKKSKTYENWGDIQDCEIVLIENYPCESKDQLHARERYYIENNDCVNKCIPTQTLKEYREKNKDKRNEYTKDWREKNKDKLKQQFNCECGSKYTYSRKSKHFKTIKHQQYLKSQTNIDDAVRIHAAAQKKTKEESN